MDNVKQSKSNKNKIKQIKDSPNCWNNKLTEVCVTGNDGLMGGCKACLSPAPILNLTWGPPGGGTWIHPKILPTKVSKGTGKFST